MVMFAMAVALYTVPQRLTFADELVSPQGWPQVWPHQGERHYVVQRADDPMVLGTVQVTWRHDGKRYALRSVSETAGLLAALKPARTVQESLGELGAEGLRPLSFSYEKKRGTDSASFDWSAGVLHLRNEQVALLAGTQDLLSLNAQLALHPVRGGVRDILVVTGSKLQSYHLEVAGEERLMLGAHSYASVHVYALSGNERIDFWLPEPGKSAKLEKGQSSLASFALPLRIRVTDKNGMVLDQSLDTAGSAH